MLLKLKITPVIAEKAIQRMVDEDMSYYAITQQNVNKLSPEFWSEFGAVVDLFCLRYGANKIGETTTAWITSGGNALVIDTDQFVAIYCGVQQAARQLAQRFIDDFQRLEVIKYESSMPEFCQSYE